MLRPPGDELSRSGMSDDLRRAVTRTIWPTTPHFLAAVFVHSDDRAVLRTDMQQNTFAIDHWRCRFLYDQSSNDIPGAEVARLLNAVETGGLRWMHLEKLQEWNGKLAYTKAQGED